jgi:lysophospholipase L1-like esterase
MAMRARAVWCALLVTLATATRLHAADSPYYLALGDSLAIGIQPAGDGSYVPTNRGYVDDLHALLHTRFPALQLAKLGCSGETTSSMISGLGSPCSYQAGSQLSEAVAFLQSHRVALITLDIGADNLLQCFDLTIVQIDPTCIANTLSTAPNDLAGILSALHNASPHTLIVGMNYYDPFLAAWVFGPSGRALAAASLPIIRGFNLALETVYQALHVPVADVAAIFHIDGRRGVTGLNVALALTWTWMGAPPPRGPDVHPNALGYSAIAFAFAKAIAAQ